ncbi:pectin lyase fold/virulence factor [Niveomyces insectorum RCEF 264]|uniref:Pectin lyase fold/virulence factor n=1 Tax=Niveomyces insectorum RCEF 264 TaxID=1081102 RepID=A0A167QFQ1_9HYPO|nr:pectin lyase fold/virulence factor [Niveomyces insectorum RCEF 264]
MPSWRHVLAVVWATLAGTVYAGCQVTQLYVDAGANATIGLQKNGSSPQTAFGNVFDAERHLKYLLAQENDGNTQVVINLAPGVYPMQTYLRLSDRHSGSQACPTIWQASGGGKVVLSGATQITNWTAVSAMDGVYSAAAPPGSRTRALFVDGVSMPRARSAPMLQNHSTYTDVGFMNDSPGVNFSAIQKLQHVELRSVGTFVDRYSPVDFLTQNNSGFPLLVMKQPAWYRNLIGYDTVTEGDVLGLFLENSLTFLDADGEWYLDVEANTLYYRPVDGKDPNTSVVYLPVLELVLAVGGFTYDRPAHDMQFVNITFAHTTWNYPSSAYGFADQQTGTYIGEPWNRTTFEETRPHWYMTPGTVQVSAAQRITFRGGGITCTGAAGLGIGNDDNAHVSSVGLGAQDILVDGLAFTQTGGNALQVGGVGLNAHHPILPAMVNARIVAQSNTFDHNAVIYNSGANILFTYVQHSSVVQNTIRNTPYSGICFGYGWGSNDPGGTPLYVTLGLYNFQPVYTTPTTAHDNLVARNYIENVGLNHTDLGGIYTLSMNNGTRIEGNVISRSRHQGLYFDEGSRYFTARNNVVDAEGDWLFLNFQTGDLTGNQTVVDNWGSTNDHLNNGTDQYGDYINNNTFFNATEGWPAAAQDIINAAGSTPGKL